MQLTPHQIIEATKAMPIVMPVTATSPGARADGPVVCGCTWDSRDVKAGELFVAIKGEHADGNDHIASALDRGAKVILATSELSAEQKQLAETLGRWVIYKQDGRRALADLAGFWREQLTAKVVAITGSSGKTSTRNLVAAVLSQAFKCHSAHGNQNNELGLPATVLGAELSDEVLVCEMGMRGLGQIAELCSVARPHIGIITNIGQAHMELLGSKDNIARAKAELIEALPASRGIGILNGDDPYSSRIRELADVVGRDIGIVQFGLGKHNDIRADNIAYDAGGRPSFDLWGREGSYRSVKLQLHGTHSIYNALAATAAGLCLGMDLGTITDALEQALPVPMRQEVVELMNGITLIDDSYNANPDSMFAALMVLEKMDAKRMHIAVLGDMGELGDTAAELHRSVGKRAAESGVEVIVAVGDLAEYYTIGAKAAERTPSTIIATKNVSEAMRALKPYTDREPIILVKASRSMAFERIVDGLKRTAELKRRTETGDRSDGSTRNDGTERMDSDK